MAFQDSSLFEGSEPVVGGLSVWPVATAESPKQMNMLAKLIGFGKPLQSAPKRSDGSAGGFRACARAIGHLPCAHASSTHVASDCCAVSRHAGRGLHCPRQRHSG